MAPHWKVTGVVDVTTPVTFQWGPILDVPKYLESGQIWPGGELTPCGVKTLKSRWIRHTFFKFLGGRPVHLSRHFVKKVGVWESLDNIAERGTSPQPAVTKSGVFAL